MESAPNEANYVLGMARNCLRSIDSVNPLENRRRLGAERDELVEQCQAPLKNPAPQ